MRFDNATGQTQALGETESATTALEAPPGLPTTPDAYVQIDLSVDAAGHPTWRRPVRTWFRRDGGGWTLVGLERMPAGGAARFDDAPRKSPGKWS